jgi:hypothetical protein
VEIMTIPVSASNRAVAVLAACISQTLRRDDPTFPERFVDNLDLLAKQTEAQGRTAETALLAYVRTVIADDKMFQK